MYTMCKNNKLFTEKPLSEGHQCPTGVMGDDLGAQLAC